MRIPTSPPVSFKASFSSQGKVPWKWDPETGERSVFPYEKKKNVLSIKLKQLESLLIVFDKKSGQPEKQLEIDTANAMGINGSWKLNLNHIHKKAIE